MGKTLDDRDFVCPHCGRKNTLTVCDLPEETPVNCSACTQVLGVWGSVRQPVLPAVVRLFDI